MSKWPVFSGALLFCAGFAMSLHSIWTTADYHLVGFALTAVGAGILGRSLGLIMRPRSDA